MAVPDYALRLCRELDVNRVRYHLDIAREGAIIIAVAVPGDRWESGVLHNGNVEVERFISRGVKTG
jgi:hypothetical protein